MDFENNSINTIKKLTGLFTVLGLLASISVPASAQNIFHLDASGPQNTTSIHRTNIETEQTERLISSAPNFTTAHYSLSEDSVFLWTGSDVIKTGRDFKTYRLVTSVEGSWSNVYTDFDTENQVMYYNFATSENRDIYSRDLATGQIDTVITLIDGDVVDIAHSDSGITYALSLGFGESVIVHTTLEGEADTLHTIDTGSYEKVIVDDVNEYIYFVHEESFSTTNLFRMNLDGTDLTLIGEMQDNFRDLSLDKANQNLFIQYSNQKVMLFDLNADVPEEELLFTSDYRIDRTFLDAGRSRIFFYSLGGGVIEYDTDTADFNIIASFKPNENVLLLDERDERIYYFAYANAQSALYSINYNGEDNQLISEFTDIYVATDARDAKLDTLNNHIYFITRRAVKRIALAPGSVEETLISYPFSSGTSLRALALDVEREQLYLYKEDDGIYSLTFDGSTETVVTTEGRFENEGLTYNPTHDKIYYTSNRHYMVNPDGSERAEWPRFSSLEVDKIEYNVHSNQLLMAQQSVRFDDDMNSIYEERVRYLNFDESFSTGIYVNMPMSSTTYNVITSFAASFPAISDSVGTNAEDDISDLPGKISLSQNYPNPFNPSTMIRFQLPASSQVSLRVYDMLGREVAVLLRGERMAAGTHTISFNAGNLSSGMYIYRLQAGDQILSKKLTLIK